MIDKIKKLIMFIAIIFGVTLFAAEDKKAPNEIIKDNPKKEVTTVESMKVRDHATMSLSVTKSKPEEIMGSLSEDGKLSVFLYKKQAKKSTRGGSTKDIDVKNFKLKAYTNTKNDNPMMLRANTKDKNMPQNLSAEDIRSMMNSNAASKEKKINVVEESDEYVRLEIEDVQENEKVYISVMNGDSVVKSYRIEEIRDIKSNNHLYCWGPGLDKTDEYAVEDERKPFSVGGYNKNSGKYEVWIDSVAHRLKSLPSATYYVSGRVASINTESDGDQLKALDEYFPASYLQINKKYVGVGGKIVRNTYTDLEPSLVRIQMRNFTLSNEKAISNYSISYRTIEHPTTSGLKDYLVYYDGNNTEFGFKNISLIYDGIDFNDPKISLCNYSSIADNEKSLRARFTHLGYNVRAEFLDQDYRPGLYEFGGNNGAVMAYFKRNEKTYGGTIAIRAGVKKYEIALGDMYMDLRETGGVQIPYDKVKVITKESNDKDNYLRLVDDVKQYSKVSLSFMKLNPTQDTGGLWIHTSENNKPIFLEKGRELAFEYNQNGKKQQYYIRATQNQNEYVQLEIKGGNLQNPDLVSEKPKVEFYISQGKMIEGFNGSKTLGDLRKVKYIVTFPRVIKVEDKININIQVDERIKNLISSEQSGHYTWIDLNGGFGKWGDSKPKMPEIIYIDQVYNDTTNRIKEVESVNKKLRDSDTSDGYDRFKMDGNDRFNIVFKRDVTFTDLSKSSNVMISPTTATSYETIYQATEISTNREKKFKSTITLDYAKNTSNNTDMYYDIPRGFFGNGSINLTGRKIDNEYTLINKANGTPLDNELTLVTHEGYLPNFKGLVSGQTDKQIVSKYKVNGSEFININDSNGFLTSDGALRVRLIKPQTLSEKKMIKITKLKDITFAPNKNIKIEYYHSSGVKLGEYMLDVSNTRTLNNLGEAKVEIDARIAQLNEDYSWLKLRTGEVFNLKKNSGTLGSYRDFIGSPTIFSNAGSFGKYNDVLITNIEEINNSSAFAQPDYFYTDNVEYEGITNPHQNQAAYPKGQTLGNFINTDETTTKLIVSKWDVTSSEHKKENSFLVSGMKGNQPVAFIGNLKEIYLNKVGQEITSTIDKAQNIFLGSGTLNLAAAKVGTSYWFDKVRTLSGELKGNGSADDVILKLGSHSDPLNAAGIISKTKNKRVANKMLMKVAGVGFTIDLAGNKLESSEIEIDQGKIKVGIDEQGRLLITKTQEGNIPRTTINIKYYYNPNTNMTNNEIHLGTFDLTIENPVITSTKDVIVEIDKRFIELERYNWLYRNGTSEDIGNRNKIENKFSDFFKFNGDLDQLNGVSGPIEKDLSVENRAYRYGGTDYSVYLTAANKWENASAIPINRDITELNNSLVISKLNGNSPNLENKFSLIFNENGTHKIYMGNIKEEIKEARVYEGKGIIKIREAALNTVYKFSTILTNKIINSDNGLKITEATDPLNALGVVTGKTTTMVANKIRVTFTDDDNNTEEKYASISENNFTASHGGIVVGITKTGNNIGGLNIQKTIEKPSIKNIVIEYFYDTTPNDNDINTNITNGDAIKLGKFTLTIEKDFVTIDPNDAFLDFRKMFYDSRYGGETYETREKSFKVINESGKDIDFRVEKDTGEMFNNSNKVELRNISVKKDSNTKFTLQATAVLDKNTKPGAYQGEIQVIVDIVTPSKP